VPALFAGTSEPPPVTAHATAIAIEDTNAARGQRDKRRFIYLGK
jgi:hypothetical protein